MRRLFILLIVQGFAFAANPVNEWLMNEQTGTSISGTGSGGNTGVLMSGTTASVHGPEWVVDSQRGTVLSFDGAGDYVLTNSDGVLGDSPRSVTCWFYLAAAQYRHTLVEWGDGSVAGGYFRLLIEDNRFRMEVSSGNSLAMNTGDLALNQWHHVALVLDDFNNDGKVATFDAKFYHNGEFTPRTAYSGRALNTVQNGDDWVRLGGGAQNATSGIPREPLCGMLDDVRIYNVALTPSEIIEDMGQETAWAPAPADGSQTAVSTESFSWLPGSFAESHNVYFGTDSAAVGQATTANPMGLLLDSAQITGPDAGGRYEISLAGVSLAPETTYFWRVDELNPSEPASPWKGGVWSFTTTALALAPQNLTSSEDMLSLVLSWDAPADMSAPLYDVLIAEDAQMQKEVARATGLSTDFWQADTAAMTLGRPYYWRVDAQETAKPAFHGTSEIAEISFEAPLTIEDFDAYYEIEALTDVWQGAAISLSYEADGQSMRLAYDNRPGNPATEVEKTYSVPQNWLSRGTSVLQFLFRGGPDNIPALLYIELKDSDGRSGNVYYDGSEDDLVVEKWSDWLVLRAPLADFAEQGVDVEQVQKLVIGLESPTTEPSSGAVFIDCIELDLHRCLPEFATPEDLNQDCAVNSSDLKLLAEYWLASSYSICATTGAPSNQAVYYPFDEAVGLVADDRSGNGFDGALQTDDAAAIHDASGFIIFDGSTSVAIPSTAFSGVDSSFSISIRAAFDENNASHAERLEFGLGFEGEMAFCAYPEISTGWHHLCLTQNGIEGVARIYCDGLLLAQADSSSVVLNGAEFGLSRIGAEAGGDYGFFKGAIDEFRLYDKALSHQEVVFLYAGASQVIEQPLVPFVSPFDPSPNSTIDLADYSKIATSWLWQTQ